MSLPKVAVLLSSFNGSLYIGAQIDSILRQRQVDCHLFVRDDGSSDATAEIVAAYGDRLTFIQGHNIGPAKSFLSLLAQVEGYDYYAFADQDDIWLEGKLEAAVVRLQQEPVCEPLLYFARVDVCDATLQKIDTHPRLERPPNLENALIQCCGLGCTFVLNKSAQSLLTDHACPSEPSMHDWWAYLVCAALGKVVFDDTSVLLYRQHEDNFYGRQTSLATYMTQLKDTLAAKKLGAALAQAEALRDIYGAKIQARELELVTQFIKPRKTFIERLRYVLQTGLVKQHWVGSLAFRFAYLVARQKD